jgi:hypothetical protein
MYIFKDQSILQHSLEVQQLPNLHKILKNNDKITLTTKILKTKEKLSFLKLELDRPN